MNISSSVGQASMFGQLSNSNVNINPNAPVKPPVRPVEPVTVSESPKESSSGKISQKIVIDEQAIAIFEQNEIEQSPNYLAAQAQSKKENFSSTGQDQPLPKNETAVASYQAVSNLSQRESVQQLFGVDLFA